MCGIFGMIGKPPSEKKPVVYAMLTALAVQTQQRGTHATGYAGFDESGRMIAAKAPLKAEDFVKTTDWTRFERDEIPSFFIGHCRWATHGSPAKNENNHPFLSQDGTKALIHNGVVAGHYQIARESNLKLVSECDSEVILRMIEHEPTDMKGIKAVFTKVFLGFSRDGAVAMLDATAKKAFLFRSQSKPCHAVRIEELGNALVFASTESILKAGLAAAGIEMGKGFDLKAYRVYEIGFGTEVGPTIETTDIQFKQYKATDFWTTALPAPATTAVKDRSYRVGKEDSYQGTLFDESCKMFEGDLEGEWQRDNRPRGYDLEEVQCPCGNVMFLFKSESRECQKCHKYLLRVGQPPARRPSISPHEEMDEWLTLHCEVCGTTFQQLSILRASCIKCGSTYVSVRSTNKKPGRSASAKPLMGIHKCGKCGLRYVADKCPERCSCGNNSFVWEGELNASEKAVLRTTRPTGGGRVKKCHDCGKELKNPEWSRCEECHRKRKDIVEKFKQFPWRCDKCGQRVAENVKECPKCKGELFTYMR